MSLIVSSLSPTLLFYVRIINFCFRIIGFLWPNNYYHNYRMRVFTPALADGS